MKHHIKITIPLTICCLAVIGFLSFCSANSEIRQISKALNLKLTGAEIAESTDTHGGFHGDGYTFTVISIPKKHLSKFSNNISKATGWHSLPLTERMSQLVYDGLCCDDDLNDLFPKIEQGYYFFCDRHDNRNSYKLDKYFYERYSYNFTVAMYDSEHGRLYYYELDT